MPVYAHPKFTRIVDEVYLDWIRAKRCSVLACRVTPCDAHHIKTVGSGGHDHMTIPLCRHHHTMLQDAPDLIVTKMLGRSKWEEAFILFYEWTIKNGWIHSDENLPVRT